MSARGAGPGSSVRLAFMAFDPHELLCHFLALERGHYADAGLEVELADASFAAEAEPPERTLLVACGSALLARAAGARLRVVLVACQRPMFWVFGPEAGGLAGARLAGFPPGSPPALLIREALANHGLDPSSRLELLAARDDAARIGLLRAGAADAAAVSSAGLAAVERLPGTAELADVGESVRLPSTGLAASEALLERDPALVAAVADAHRLALATLADDPGCAAGALERGFGWGAGEAAALLGRLPGRFSADGRPQLEAAVEAAGRLTGLARDELQRFYSGFDT